jgi:hypothetical protein
MKNILACLVLSSVSFSAQAQNCGTPIDCYQKSIKNLQEAEIKLQSATNLFSNNIAALKIPLIDQGVVGGANSIPGDNWQLHLGNGQRDQVLKVKFTKKFKTPPKVFTALSTLDTAIGGVQSTRLSVTATNVSNEGCDIVISTWADSVVYFAKVSWMAISE